MHTIASAIGNGVWKSKKPGDSETIELFKDALGKDFGLQYL